jgi:V/A-type H+-transporting ATPase subunit E
MDVKLENLIEKIKADGVEQAKQMADEILMKAKKESESILQDSRNEAGKIIEKSQKEAAVFEEKSKLAIKQAARDTELLVKEKLTSLFDRVFKKEISKTLTPDFLQGLILQLTSKWDNKTSFEIVLSEEDKSSLEKLLFSSLKNELKGNISIKISDNVSKGFHIRLEKEHLYYDFSDDSIADILKSFINPRLKEIIDERNG